MMKHTVIHVIPHSHLDREWYMGYEKHRARLLNLMEDLMELFEKDPAYTSFHMDGQTITLDDYLEIHPEMGEKVKELVKERKLSAGPWYILQDEFLTSGEAAIRNLLTGMREAGEYGGICPVGYFPDAFGNAGQMPQLLKQAGMEAVVFGRGVRTVGGNNELGSGGKYDSAFSEMYWESPDGSRLPGILFANWYNNGAEIPVEEERAKAYWDKKLAAAKAVAGTRHLLFMNGCDHQPVQKDLSAALETARRLYPDIEFIQTDFPSYIKAVLPELPENTSIINGELTSQETDGMGTLVNTCSARVDLKRMNRMCETLLEKQVEPLTAMAALHGIPHDEKYLQYSWKKLMQNHPHDSICSCSVDEVNRGIEERFAMVKDAGSAIADEMMDRMVFRLAEENSFETSQGEIWFAVFSAEGKKTRQFVSATLDLNRIWGDLNRSWHKMKEMPFPALMLVNEKGEEIEASFEDLGPAFGYTLPVDRFRRPYAARKVKVEFSFETDGIGYHVFQIRSTPKDEKIKKTAEKTSLQLSKRYMENERLRVEVNEDGTFTLTDKASGRSFRNLGYYEDAGDIGNEYIFKEAADEKRFTTKGLKAAIEIIKDTPAASAIRITHFLALPVSASDELEEETASMVWFPYRKARRSEEMTEVKLETILTLEQGAQGLKIHTILHNTARDHRMQIMFPTEVQSEKHFADSSLEVVERNNRHGERWKNPSGCEHVQKFIAMEDENGGLLAAGFGLYEYEILPERDNTMALTILRAVGEMGDWGYFPTPDAQMLKTIEADVELVPFMRGKRSEAYDEGYRFMSPCLVRQIPVGVMGTVPPDEKKESGLRFLEKRALEKTYPLWRGLRYEGDFITLTAFKCGENQKDLILRFVNVSSQAHVLSMHKEPWMKSLYRSNVIEEMLREAAEEDRICAENDTISITLKPFEILTVRVVI